MKYRYIAAMMLALLLMLSAGCAKEAEVVPQSSVPGYFSGIQNIAGGSRSVKDASLVGAGVQREGEEVCIALRFATGEGVFSGKKMPEYAVEPMNGPTRLKVVLPQVFFAMEDMKLDSAGEFFGVVTEQTAEGVVLYLQFTGQVAYKAEENTESGELVLRVRADDAPSVEQYHVRVPYSMGSAVAAEYELTPALCEDGENAYSLSAGYESIEQADALCKTVNAALEEAGSDDTAEVIRMNSGEAPVYTEPVTRSMLTMMGALKTEEAVLDGELVAMDARFLCWTDDGGMLMARPIVTETAEGNAITGEELWVYNLNTGRRERLAEAEFASVQKAAFSKDKRYIAILDAQDGARLMYLFDRHNKGLTFLTAEGMGDYTADFAWGKDGRLYAMCGEDHMQLMAYDPALALRGEDALAALEEREGSFGSVGWANGKVCFSDADGKIYALDTETKERELLEESSGFLLSPDGNRMLLIDAEEAEGSTLSTLRVRDMKSGLSVQIAAQASVSAYVWAEDSSALFYLTSNKGAADAEDYPVRLMRYLPEGGVTEEMGVLASNTIFRGKDQDSIIVLFYQDRGGVFYPITYSIDLKGGELTQEDELIVTIEE